jgi:hypothetical protein
MCGISRHLAPDGDRWQTGVDPVQPGAAGRNRSYPILSDHCCQLPRVPGAESGATRASWVRLEAPVS